MKDKKKLRVAKQLGMVFLFSASYFLMFIITIILSVSGIFLLARFGIIDDEHIKRMPLFMTACVSLIIGTVMSLIFSRIPLKTFYKSIGRNTLRELTISQLKDADTPEKHRNFVNSL